MKQTFTFNAIPAALDEFKALPEAALQSPFQTVALTLLALCRYRDDRDAALAMLDFLKGPEAVSPYEKQFLRDRLEGKEYKPFSFFAGAAVENDYTPAVPLTVTDPTGREASTVIVAPESNKIDPLTRPVPESSPTDRKPAPCTSTDVPADILSPASLAAVYPGIVLPNHFLARYASTIRRSSSLRYSVMRMSSP